MVFFDLACLPVCMQLHNNRLRIGNDFSSVNVICGRYILMYNMALEIIVACHFLFEFHSPHSMAGCFPRDA